MRPSSILDTDILRSNVRALSRLGKPIAAVVKSDGYGWGAVRIARAIEDLVESFFVSDADEFDVLSAVTRRSVRLIGEVPVARVRSICEAGGIPNIASLEGLRAAASISKLREGIRIRLGTLQLAGWTTPPQDSWEAITSELARSDIEVELWSHITRQDKAAEACETLLLRRDALQRRGVRVCSIDIESSAHLECVGPYARQRVGAGLFGGRFGRAIDTKCAISMSAPVVGRFAPGAYKAAGYENRDVRPDQSITLIRCGYGDGFPRSAAGLGDVISVGMQYIVLAGNASTDEYSLLASQDGLDEKAASFGTSVHELIIATSRANPGRLPDNAIPLR